MSPVEISKRTVAGRRKSCARPSRRRSSTRKFPSILLKPELSRRPSSFTDTSSLNGMEAIPWSSISAIPRQSLQLPFTRHVQNLASIIYWKKLPEKRNCLSFATSSSHFSKITMQTSQSNVCHKSRLGTSRSTPPRKCLSGSRSSPHSPHQPRRIEALASSRTCPRSPSGSCPLSPAGSRERTRCQQTTSP